MASREKDGNEKFESSLVKIGVEIVVGTAVKVMLLLLLLRWNCLIRNGLHYMLLRVWTLLLLLLLWPRLPILLALVRVLLVRLLLLGWPLRRNEMLAHHLMWWWPLMRLHLHLSGLILRLLWVPVHLSLLLLLLRSHL